MSTASTRPPKVNRIGLEVLGYKGGKTTLCAGCGHNAVSQRIIECFFDMGVPPWDVAKFSGIDIRTIVAPGKVKLTLIGPGIEASDTISVKE